MPLAVLVGVMSLAGCAPALTEDEIRQVVRDEINRNASGLHLLDAIGKQDVVAVEQHMDAGIDPNGVFIPEEFPFAGASALHLAVMTDNAEIGGILLKSGALIDIKAKDVFGATPLIWAAFGGGANMVQLLVERGASLEATDVIGNKPLDAARANNE